MATTTRPEPLSAEQREIVREAARYADSWVALRARTQLVPGVQVAVAVAGELLLSSAHGFARLPGTNSDADRGEELSTRHLFRIASHSKTFTATAVMQLFEAGSLRLDDTVGEHVAALAGSPIGDRTLAELLAHGGGVVRDTDDANFWQLEREFPDSEALIAACLDGADVLESNERFKYSNIGYGVLGLVVEAVSGRPYADYVAEHVVGRLGLRDTGPELDASRADEYATGYSSRAAYDRRLPIDPVDTRALASATGFWSTAEDLCRYTAGHVLGDERLLSDASKRRMQRGEWEVEGTDERYGLGFNIRNDRRAPHDRPRRRLPRPHHLHLPRSGGRPDRGRADERDRRSGEGAGSRHRQARRRRARLREGACCGRRGGRRRPRVVHGALRRALGRDRRRRSRRPLAGSCSRTSPTRRSRWGSSRWSTPTRCE